MEILKYLCIYEADIDSMITAHNTQDEAEEEAHAIWSHLTRQEKKRSHVYVAAVQREDLDPLAFDDDEIDWTFCHSYTCIPGAFDSTLDENP